MKTILDLIFKWGASKREEFQIENVGVLKLDKDGTDYFWFGNIPDIFQSGIHLELGIEVDGKVYPSEEQIELIKYLLGNKETISDILFLYMEESFRGTKWEKKKEELEKMYFISAIEIKRNSRNVWVVLEPEVYVPTIFNFFPRFTLNDYNIVWSNV
ncbi:MAG: hypothetical protein NVV82_17645 [Sporocytophaga sp.]|nr:hypothetical protein [Sporocytophaga sp.]